MNIARQRIVRFLHLRGQQVRADWVERELPERVDTEEHAGLLAILRPDPADLVHAPSREGRSAPTVRRAHTSHRGDPVLRHYSAQSAATGWSIAENPR